MDGTFLKKELDNRGIKYAHVSDNTGISYVSLSRYLNGRQDMPEARVRLVCLTYGIPLKIFGLSDPNLVQGQANQDQAS